VTDGIEISVSLTKMQERTIILDKEGLLGVELETPPPSNEESVFSRLTYSVVLSLLINALLIST